MEIVGIDDNAVRVFLKTGKVKWLREKFCDGPLQLTCFKIK